jgi:hypothetical protein
MLELPGAVTGAHRRGGYSHPDNKGLDGREVRCDMGLVVQVEQRTPGATRRVLVGMTGGGFAPPAAERPTEALPAG